MNISMTVGATKGSAAHIGAGLRRTTPGSVRAGKLARAYHQEDAPRWARTVALRMLKLAAPRLGLDAIKLALIDVLFACSKAADWTDRDGLGPIVWPSNILLARRMNMPVNTLRYHLRILGDLGLITWCDDAGYRRHGKRDENGRIIEAFGIDLSPIAMRHEEFKALVEAAEEDAREIGRLCRRRMSLDKAIRSLVDGAFRSGLDADTDGAFSHGLARRDVLCELPVKDLDALMRQVADFEELHDRLEGLYEGASEPLEESFEVSRYRHPGVKMLTPHTYTAPISDSVKCNQNRIAHTRRASPTDTDDTVSIRAAYGSRALEEKPRANSAEHKQSTVETEPPAESPNETGVAPDANAKRDIDPPEQSETADQAAAPPQGLAPVAETATQATQATAATPAGAINALSSARAGRSAGNPGDCGDISVTDSRGKPVGGKQSDAVPGTAGKPAGDDVPLLSIGLLRTACPAINGIAPGALEHWQTLRESGHALCMAADINPQVFDEASDTLGPDIAIAAIAVTVQKAAQGDVFNPGAYLRTLTKRGKAGKLHIAKSLHGLAAINGMAAETAEKTTSRTHDAGDGGSDNSPDPDENRTIGHQGSPQQANATPHDAGARGGAATIAAGAPVADAAPKPSAAFPATGTIAYSPWADIVRQNAPEPVPDVDRVAGAFRAFCVRHAIDTTSPNIKTVFTTFCAKWTERL